MAGSEDATQSCCISKEDYLSINVSEDGMTQSASATVVTNTFVPLDMLKQSGVSTTRQFGGRPRGVTNEIKQNEEK